MSDRVADLMLKNRQEVFNDRSAARRDLNTLVDDLRLRDRLGVTD